MPLSQRQVIDDVCRIGKAKADALIAKNAGRGNIIISQEDMSAAQCFSWLGQRFYIEEALRILDHQRPTYNLDVRTFYLQFVASRAIDVHWEHVPGVDINKPVIVATLRTTGTRLDNFKVEEIDADIPIDGIHRIARANSKGLKRLLAHKLTPEQVERVRVQSDPAGVLLGLNEDWYLEMISLLPILAVGDLIHVPRAAPRYAVEQLIDAHGLNPSDYRIHYI